MSIQTLIGSSVLFKPAINDPLFTGPLSLEAGVTAVEERGNVLLLDLVVPGGGERSGVLLVTSESQLLDIDPDGAYAVLPSLGGVAQPPADPPPPAGDEQGAQKELPPHDTEQKCEAIPASMFGLNPARTDAVVTP